jgi:hypothetical protein
MIQENQKTTTVSLMHKEVIDEYGRMASEYTLTDKIYVSDVLEWNTINGPVKKDSNISI